MTEKLKFLDAVLADMHGYLDQMQVPTVWEVPIKATAEDVAKARLLLRNLSLDQGSRPEPERVTELVRFGRLTCEPLSRLAGEPPGQLDASAVELAIHSTKDLTARVVEFCGGPHGGGGSPFLLNGGSQELGLHRKGGGPHGPGGGRDE